METTDFTTQFITLIFIILLNGGTAAILYSEYSRARQEFIRFAMLAQLSNVAWHLFAVYLTFYPEFNPGILVASSIVLVASGLYLKSVQSASGITEPRWLVPSALTGTLILMLLWLVFPNVSLFIIWMVSNVIFLLTAWTTLRYSKFKQRVFIATLQFLVMPNYGIGVAILLQIQPEIGGLFYFFLGILFPAISMLLLQESVELSTRQIANSEKLHRELLQSVRDIFFHTDAQGKIEVISPSVQQIGFDSAALIGESLRTLYVNSSLFDAHLEKIKEKEFSTVISLDVRTAGGESRECELSTNCVRSRLGDVEAIVGTIRDVSERNQLERQFIDVQRRESLGTMAGGVAHDFNNLLQGIVGRIDWLIAKPDMDEQERHAHLSVMLDASNTAARLCKQLLEYTGKAQFSIQPLSIQTELYDVAEIVRSWLPSDIQLEIEKTEHDIIIDADLTQIRQVFLNLIRNAADACVDTTRNSIVKVSVSKRYLQAKNLRGLRIEGSNLDDGEYAFIEIRDNGCGIESGIIQHIFDPFYSTKHGGHGLGLASIVGILRQHGGGITVESTPGAGSLFIVMLPISEAVHTNSPLVSALANDGCDKTVLFADDEIDIRLVTVLTLEDKGYRVLVAEDGQQAIDLFNQHKEDVSVVLLDIKMPVKDGIQAAREIRQLSPTMPIVLASGNPDISGRLSPQEMASLRFLAKPYRSSEILEALEQAHTAAAPPERSPDENLAIYSKTR